MASGPADPLRLVKERVEVALAGNTKKDKWDKIIGEDAVKPPMERFLTTPECKILLVSWGKGDELIASNLIPSHLPSAKKKSIVFLKLTAVALNQNNFIEHVHTMELTGNPLDQFGTLSGGVLFPLVEKRENRDQWAGTASRDILLEMNKYVSDLTVLVAESQGKTVLTIPPSDIYNKDCDTQLRNTTLISSLRKWNKQLKEAALLEPSSMFTAGCSSSSSSDGTAAKWPDCLDECDFWKQKETNLQSLVDQLKSEDISKAIDYLHNNDTELISDATLISETDENGGDSNNNSSSMMNKAPLLGSDNTKDHLIEFDNLCELIEIKLYECSSNICYLKPLKTEFEMLRDALDFNALPSVFNSVMQKILLIWKHSDYYITDERLRFLICEICNGLIAQASKFVGGEEIFRLIDDDNAKEAVEKIDDTYQICQKFEECFLKYRSKAREELGALEPVCLLSNAVVEGATDTSTTTTTTTTRINRLDAWNIDKESMFGRMRVFQTRTNDIKEFCKTVDDFSKLERIFISGNRGKDLTQQIREIFNEVCSLKNNLRNVNYDLMDITADDFETDFHNFRSSVKHLEKRLVSILTLAFSDVSSSINARFQLLDAFDDLLQRPLLKQEFRNKKQDLISDLLKELRALEEQFDPNHPKLPKNLPKYAGAIVWCRGFRQRLDPHIFKLRALVKGQVYLEGDEIDPSADPPSMDSSSDPSGSEQPSSTTPRTQVKEVEEWYKSFCEDIKEFELKQIDAWKQEINLTSEDSLKQNILIKKQCPTEDDDDDEEEEDEQQGGDQQAAAAAVAAASKKHSSSLLIVNFDPKLAKLLREAHYFQQNDIEIPDKARNIYTKNDEYKKWRCQLQVISNMYNTMCNGLSLYEYPLLEKKLMDIDEQLEQGLTLLTWKLNKEVESFIADLNQSIIKVYSIYQCMKNNVKSMKKLLYDFSSQPLCERKNKPVSPDEFSESLEKLHKIRFQNLIEINSEISNLMKSIFDSLKVASAEPKWKNFVSDVQRQILEELSKVVTNSIEWFVEQVKTMESTKSTQTLSQPLLEIQLALFNDIQFTFDHKSSHHKQNQQQQQQQPQSSKNSSSDVGESGSGASGDQSKNSENNDNTDGVGSSTNKTSEESAAVSIWERMRQWVQSFFKVGEIIRKIDGSNESFSDDLRSMSVINESLQKFDQLLEDNRTECEDYRREFFAFEHLYKTDRVKEFREFLATGVINDANNNNDENGDGTNEDSNKNDANNNKNKNNSSKTTATESTGMLSPELPPLSKFQEKIILYHQIREEIKLKETPIQIAWLKVDAQPLKQALQTWVSKWLHTYTSFLKSSVEEKMADLYTFMDTVREGLKVEVQSGDLEGLKKILGLIHRVRSQQKETRESFAPLTETIKFLRNNGVDVGESTIDKLKEAPFLWEVIVKEKDKVQDKVNPLQNEQVDNIKRKVWQFHDEMSDFRQEFRDNAPFIYIQGSGEKHHVELAYEKILYYHHLMEQKEHEALALNELENLFNIPESRYRTLTECRNENKLLKSLWDMISLVNQLFQSWRSTLWNDIDTEELLNAVNKLMKRINNMDKEVRGWKAFQGLQDEVKRYQTVLPLVNLLHSPNMKDRHWKQLMLVTNTSFQMSKCFSLGDMLDLGLHDFVENVEEVVEISEKEAKIETQIFKLKALWSGDEAQQFEYGIHEETQVPMVRIPEEVLVNLEESLSVLQGLKGQGKYVQHFLNDVNDWENKLGVTESVITDWISVQTKWSSLQSIFVGSADIREQLPDDTKRFDIIDKNWRLLMDESIKITEAVLACNRDNHAQKLEDMKKGLELCEKSLNQYLETKKMAFPRFYFLSNVALLDLLSNGNNPYKVQSNMAHCFDNIKSLEFEKTADGKSYTKNAIGMYSKDGGEYVPFHKPYKCEGAVEDWLNGLVSMMRATLKDILEKAKFTADQWELEKPRHEWLYDYCAQIALTASQIIWTEETESQFEALEDGNENALKEYYSKVCEKRLEDLIKLVIGDLKKSDRIKIMTLITVDVHNRDVIKQLIDDRIINASEFAWQRQMRYTWDGDSLDCQVCVADWKGRYSFEYIGNTGRLVITPLTDRCYITLTQALKLMMGGAPAGPAGTGKTETTKDLGRAVGLPVYVFNCSEQMNVMSLGNIFKGLCQTGAWGCFDEFNRIPIEVLSVVATQVGSFLNALRAQKNHFDLMGTEIKLVDTVGVFITMNPGYAGRTELPENLKALFRSCAMVVPDMELICENMLMSEGFLTARPLAHKFITLYSLSRELLSNQKHYDWGLRATKAVLRKAGQLKRDEPSVDEGLILMRALRDFNLPKIVSRDQPIFLRLIQDLFRGLHIEPKIFPTLNEAIIAVTKESGLQAEEMFVRKVADLSELFDVRHSVFIIGEAGTGKSQVWKTLEKAYNKLGDKSVHEIMNPKAVRNDELYGWLSASTGDWNDGILSTVMRNMCKCDGGFSSSQKNKWLILDGDIDPEWIESLNTVMDDNKVLTLVSNERIPLTASMRLLFEVSHLKNATPATVSRAGILFINESDIGWRPMIDSWIDARDDESERSTLRALFNKFITADILDHIRRNFKSVIATSDVQKLQTLCYILEGILPMIRSHKNTCSNNGNGGECDYESEMYEKHFMYAFIWSFGGNLLVDESDNYRNEFSNWFKTTFANSIQYPMEQQNGADGGSGSGSSSGGGSNTIFDYFYDEKTNELKRWDTTIKKYERSSVSNQLLVNSILVETPETARLMYHLDLLVNNSKPALFVGMSGTGKTAMIKHFLKNLDTEKFSYSGINLNSYTDATSLRRIMQQSVDKRSGRNYGPAGGKKLIYFIDDLNMPYVDTYGTQSPIALIRQHIDYGLWYDTDESDTNRKKKIIRDVQYIGAMNHKAGSFTVNDRLMTHFGLFATFTPSKDDSMTIYQSILDSHLLTFDESLQKMSNPITQGTIDLLEQMTRAPKFKPSSTKFHYQFNMRDVSNVFQGLVTSREGTLTSLQFLQLWKHECMRVFGDRLIDQSDVDAFESMVMDNCKKYFPNFKDAISSSSNTSGGDGSSSQQPLIFTSFAGQRTPDLEGIIQPIDSYHSLKESLENFLLDYNENNPQMPLVLFEMAMEHVCRIARIISQPRGNALLVGVGGSGKQSLTKLASWICGYEVFQIQVTRTYGVSDLLEDIKQLYLKSGVKGQGITFLLTDTQIVEEEWLVFVNDLLSSGDIPQLFADDEKDNIYNSLRNEAKRSNTGINIDLKSSMHDFFIKRVMQNLHLVLCMSPVGEVFRVRCRKFPALINCTSMDWFFSWPREALCSVAERFLGESELLQECMSAELRTNIAHHMAEVHLSVNNASNKFFKEERRYNYTTPKSFLELIDLYKSMFKFESDKIYQKIQRLDKGIATLAKTAKDVASLQEELEQKLVIVEEKKIAANALIERCGKEKIKVDAEKAIAMEEQKNAQGVLDEANAIRAECDEVLKKAMPALESAKDAVDCLTKASLTELKALKTPDPKILEVTKAVLILKEKEKKNFSWKRAQAMMAKVDQFKRELEDFDKEHIDESLLKIANPVLKQDFFNRESMMKISQAAANLALWVLAVVEYNTVYKEVAPKMEAADKATVLYDEAMAKLRKNEENVAAKEAQLKKVTDELEEAIDEKNRVQADADACLERKKLAERLVGGLSEENVRWGAGVERFQEQQRTLVGDVLLQSAFVSYIGAFNQSFRQYLWEKCWIKDLLERSIPLSANIANMELSPMDVLSSEPQRAKWANEGLPVDSISIENAAMVASCTRWPLLIDPQQQGVKWIRNREPDLVVINLNQSRWLSILTRAVESGQTVLIENVGENIDPALEPILSRSIIKKGRSMRIRISGEEKDYDPKFKLYIQTKLSNPHYKPEIFAQCTLINFIVTEKGLEEQLLALVVNDEKPELEQTKQSLMRSINEYMVSLNDLENELLYKLSNAPEDILSDVSLIESLENTKKASKEIEQSVAQAKIKEGEINEARNQYRPVAQEASWVYFLLIQLNSIDHMYQYSLDAFITFFYKAIRRAQKSDDVKHRVQILRDEIRLVVFTWVSRGLFESHKLIFSAQLLFILMNRGAMKRELNPTLFAFLIFGQRKYGEENRIPWLSDGAWQSLCKLSELEGMERFLKDLVASPKRFHEWYLKTQPEVETLPLDWRKLDEKDPFAKLCVVRSMRPDRITSAVEKFVREEMPNGRAYTELDAAGADPVQSVYALALKKGIVDSGGYHRVAMGQGQDVIAMQKLQLGSKHGHWVVLENIHLMPRWCKELEKTLDTFDQDPDTHQDFRLFLSAEPNVGIPIGILERSIKLTNEPPQGIKANLKRAFASFSKEEFDFRESQVKAIQFALCWFHSVMIERKKFGPKGWNAVYPFNTGDLVNSGTVLVNKLEGGVSKIPWADLQYIFGEIMYGGHITDDWDRLLCMTYLRFYMNDALFEDYDLIPFVNGGSGGAGSGGAGGGSGTTNVHFIAPSDRSYDEYFDYIDEHLPAENPLMLGLHPNTEIAVRTEQCNKLFSAIVELMPRSGGGSGVSGQTPQQRAASVLEEILEKCEDLGFDLEETMANLSEEDRGPYQYVFLQECDRMNKLVSEIKRSLRELDKGLHGELTMSERMEDLQNALFLERVPPGWSNLAYPSQRPLSSWIENLLARYSQLQTWVDNPTSIPPVVNVSYLFNPQSFLTAVMQTTARRNSLELDKLAIVTEVTRKSVEDIDEPARDGAYICGLNLEGAKWNTGAGTLDEAEPREMFCPLPVVNCKTVLSTKLETKGIYNCPVYQTQQRGPTYVFTAPLRTKEAADKWILAGVVIIMDYVQ